jgi:hypothetical protein
MKTYITLLLALLFAGAAQAQDYPVTASLKGAEVVQALNLYSGLTGKALVIEPGVTNRWKRITLEINPPVSKNEGIKQLESALRKQADVVITPLDDKRMAVKLAKKDRPAQPKD